MSEPLTIPVKFWFIWLDVFYTPNHTLGCYGSIALLKIAPKLGFAYEMCIGARGSASLCQSSYHVGRALPVQTPGYGIYSRRRNPRTTKYHSDVNCIQDGQIRAEG